MMARIKEMTMHRHGKSMVVAIPKEYREIQSRQLQKERKVLIAFLSPDEIMRYETECQILTK